MRKFWHRNAVVNLCVVWRIPPSSVQPNVVLLPLVLNAFAAFRTEISLFLAGFGPTTLTDPFGLPGPRFARVATALLIAIDSRCIHPVNHITEGGNPGSHNVTYLDCKWEFNIGLKGEVKRTTEA